MKHLKSIGDVVYIKLSLPEIERRLDNIKTRGIAMKPGVTLADLYNQRVPLYEKYADIVLETEGMGIEESIEALIKKM
jgi:shikimate kinase